MSVMTHSLDEEHDEGSETFALSGTDSPLDVSVWAQPDGPDGRFTCLNGAWRGRFDGTHVHILGVGDPGEPIPAVEVWRGVVPRGRCRDYNDAINWITEQICPETT